MSRTRIHTHIEIVSGCCCILCLHHSPSLKQRTDPEPLEPLVESVRQRFTAQLDPPPSSGTELHRNLHSIIAGPTQTFSWSGRALTVVGTGLRVLRWKDPAPLIFTNKVWTHWSAAALCIIVIITLMRKAIAVLNATLDIYMKLVCKQVMKSRRLMTVC